MDSGTPSITIEPADIDDIDAIIDVDKAASRLFEPTGLLHAEALDDHVSAGALKAAIERNDLDVARAPQAGPVGFALVSNLGEGLYLDQISVHPSHGQQGIGTRLVEHVLRTAQTRGHPYVTLSTFRDLPWNAPFYAALGFEVLPREALQPSMLEIEAAQKPHMDISKRVFMIRHVRKGQFRARRPA